MTPYPDTIIDFHTHRLAARHAVVSLSPAMACRLLADTPTGITISVGVHPWDSQEDIDPSQLEHIIAREQVVAVGESGLDTLRGADIETQERLFELHIELSEKYHKPLIIHCVKAWDRLIAIKRRLRPMQPWGVHGFRGSPELARQLLSHGMYISLGEHFNTATAAIVPSARLLVETDESHLPLDEIIARVAACRSDSQPITPAATLREFLSPATTRTASP